MKFAALLFILVLLFACEEKNAVSFLEKRESQEQISRFYQKNIQMKMAVDSAAVQNISHLEQLAQSEPQEFQAMIAIMWGLHHSHKGFYQLGLKHYEKAHVLLQNSKVDSLKAKVLLGLGNNYKVLGNHKKAVQNLYAALALYEKNKDTLGIGCSFTLLGDVYFQMDQLPKAKDANQKAMHILKNQPASVVYLSATHSLANYYGMKGEYAKALALDEMGIRICDSLSLPKMKVSFLDNKANCFLFSNQMDSAYYYFNECLKLDLKNGNQKQIADTYSNLGKFFMMKKEYKTAEEFVNKSISVLEAGDLKSNLNKSLGILVEIYSYQKEYKKASEVNKKLIQNYKLMLQEREANALAEYKIVYETQKKEARIKVLELENKVRKLKIKQQELQVKRSNYTMILVGLLFLFLLVFAYFWWHHQQLKNKLERQLIVKETEEAERVRMAKDIHDDLGSDLSKINFLSELLSQQAKDLPAIKHHTELVQETAKKMIDNMRDLIWAMNPENTTVANFVARIREHTTDYLEDYSVEVVYDIPEYLPQQTVANEVHRTLFLVVKEAIHNIAKHAHATQVEFSMVLTEHFFRLSIQDNGRGFEPNQAKGNGLKNMHSRMKEINGEFILKSNSNETMVTFEVPLDTFFI